MPQAFDDLETIKQAARRLGKHPRTLMRWTRQPDGLPFIRLGQVPYLHVPTVTAWLEARIQRPNPTRKHKA
jgi:transposase-like protein